MRFYRTKQLILATVLAAVALTAEAETRTVIIKNLTNEPAELSAHVGDTVEWRNEDILVHTATARSGGFDLTVQPHSTGRYILSKPGSFDYFCRFHPNMRGTINVRP